MRRPAAVIKCCGEGGRGRKHNEDVFGAQVVCDLTGGGRLPTASFSIAKGKFDFVACFERGRCAVDVVAGSKDPVAGAFLLLRVIKEVVEANGVSAGGGAVQRDTSERAPVKALVGLREAEAANRFRRRRRNLYRSRQSDRGGQ